MSRKKSLWLAVALWTAAFILTVMLAVFQRMTGPSHPLRGTLVTAAGEAASYRLPRSNEGRSELRIGVPAVSDEATATLVWRRFPTDEPWRSVSMHRTSEDGFEARIPRQPAAGKVEYWILVEHGGESSRVPVSETVVARFRDEVPATVLIPHILAMFVSMLVSTRALFEVLRPGNPRVKVLVLTAMALLVVGGLILGPVVQRFAFGAYWTGWPFGHDLTDNKTLIAFLAWLPATVLAWRKANARLAVVAGWIVMMGIFLIPHSARGSELDWSEIEERPSGRIDLSTR